MKFGLKDADYKFIHKVIKEEIPENIKIWCFGSRATGAHKDFSDLDLMLVSDKDLSSLIGKLSEIFEESSLPIKVDIVQEKDFAKSYFKNYLNERILF